MKLLCFSLLLSLFGNKPSESGIMYRDLSWSDFRGQVPENEPAIAARTTTQIQFITSIESAGEERRYYFRVMTYFLPDSSFVRVRNDKNLRHEQTHFKIAYIASLRCMLALKHFQGCDSATIPDAEALYNTACRESYEQNMQFDTETRHGNDREAEQAWEERISLELHTLETEKPFNGRNH